jgi:hypothetical protein
VAEDLLHLDGFRPGLAVLPVRHGSLPFAEAAGRAVLSRRWSAVALDLPPQVASEYLEAVGKLPEIWAATWIQEGRRWVLPADPCDACATAARAALQERIRLEFVDDPEEPGTEDDPDLPDPAAVETLGAADFAGMALPFLDKYRHESLERRAAGIASRLLALLPGPVLAVVRLALLPDLLRALAAGGGAVAPGADEEDRIEELELLPVEPRHLVFCLGEWPFVAQEVERIRADPMAQQPPFHRWPSRVLSWARERHLQRRRARFLPVHEVRAADRFARRLALASGRHQPSMWDLVQAARACAGDSFAAAVLEAAKFHGMEPEGDRLRLGPSRARRPGEVKSLPWSNRLLPKPPRWTEIRLRRDPEPEEAARYLREWKPTSLCSHLPEDLSIERFHGEIRERARSSNLSAQSRSRPYESSLLDGLDIRETVRNFWKKEIWVREHPARSLRLDAAIIVFDDGDDASYPHRGTWYAEHAGESTLIFYATDPGADPVGPGILRSRYGGLALLFPPRHVPDVYSLADPPLGARGPLETLVAGTCLFAREKAVAFAAWDPPSLQLQGIARDAGKRLVHVPLSGFAARSLEKLRTFHVLNGKDVRGWADSFIQG